MNKDVLTEVVFGYNIILDSFQAQELSKSIFTLVPLVDTNADSYVFGVELLKKKGSDVLGIIDLTQIDFAEDEKEIQEELNKVNIKVDARAQLLVCNL